MTLAHVALGDPHVAAHNAEIDAINASQPLLVGGSVLEGVALRVQGDSYAVEPPTFSQWGVAARARARAKLTGSTYAAGGSRLIDLYWDTLSQAGNAHPTGQTLAGSNPLPPTLYGVVSLLAWANDLWNVQAGGTTYAPASPTALRLSNLLQTLEAIMAMASASQRVEVETGTTTGTWTANASTLWSGGDLRSTVAQNAKIDVPVTFTASGKAWVVGLATAAGGAFTLKVDGVTQQTVAAGPQWESIVSRRNNADTTYAYGPWCLPVTATPGAHTVTITKTDAGANAVYADVILPVAATPPKIALWRYPNPIAAGAAFLTAQNRTDIAAAATSFATQYATAVADFSNAALIDLSDLSSTTYLDSVGGAHPNDQMMKVMADRLVAQLSTWAGSGFAPPLSKV